MIPKNKIILTEAQERWLVRHYKHTKNAEIAERFHVSLSTVSRMAVRLGLNKSSQFMKKCQGEAAVAAKISNLANGTYPPKGFHIPNSEKGQFKKGVTGLQRLGEKKEAERLQKSHDSRNQTLRKERARATFGLPQKTRLRVVRQPKEKVYLKYALRKKGYILDEEDRVAYYDEQTHRSKVLEQKPQKWFSFEPVTDDLEDYE